MFALHPNLLMACRKRRLAAEAQANKQATSAGKKAKEQALLQKDDKPTPEELARRRARAGRFGSGAVDHSTVQAPSFAVSPPTCTLISQMCLVVQLHSSNPIRWGLTFCTKQWFLPYPWAVACTPHTGLIPVVSVQCICLDHLPL